MSTSLASEILDTQDEKVQPWRICPIGKHFVRKHSVHVPPSENHPERKTSIWHEHCANNPSHKDELSFHEIEYITQTYFSSLVGLPSSDLLTKIFSTADKYDIEIRGLVRYWNDVFAPDILLDANLIKALIGTESSFRKDPQEVHSAHGLMQIRNDTFRFLQDSKGELADYLIRIPRNKILNPSANICMGIRWMFQKKKLASARLKHPASWLEAILEYKGYWDVINKGKEPDAMTRLKEFYQILQGK
jgi:hypothetical protein